VSKRHNDDVRAALREAANVLDRYAATNDADRVALARRLRGLARRTREVVSLEEEGCPFFANLIGTCWCGCEDGMKCEGLGDDACPLSRGPVIVRREP
jgi:hypothetical protein